MTKTLLWISPALELRHAINGWPVMPPYPITQYTSGYWDDYSKALKKAKEDSILVDCTDAEKDKLLSHKKGQYNFIDFHGEVEVVWQWRPHESVSWKDTNAEYASTVGGANPLAQVRQVASLKPVTDARIRELEQDNSEGFEKYQELLIQNRNLKERVKELEAWKESQMNVNRDMLNGLNDKLPV